MAARSSARVRAMVGVHASFTVSDEALNAAGSLCGELALPLHIHVAEDESDISDAQERGYPGPLERLIALDALPPGSVLAHGVHLSKRQARQVARRGCWLVQNPRSNIGNGVGHPSALARNPRVALGTDGYPADMVAETAVATVEAARHGEPEDDAGARLDNGRALAAERFDMPFEIEHGGAADVVIDDPAGRHVIVDGKLVVRGGRLLTADHATVRAEAEEAAARLWAAMGDL